MNHRERVLTALEHRTPDRPPLTGSFESEVWAALRDYYMADQERILQHFGIDFREVNITERVTKVNEDIYSFMKTSKRLPDGAFEDMYGVRRRWVTKLSGHSHHYVIVHHPLANVESMDEYEFPELPNPTEAELSRAAERIGELQEEGYAITCGGIGRLFENSQQLRGFKKFFTDMYINEKFVNQLLDKLLERNLERIRLMEGLHPDIIAGGDDVGTQVGMMIRPEHWRNFIKPRLKKMISEAKKLTSAYMLYHTDGNVMPIIPDLIEVGVDILNPVQPDCMDPAEVKRLYGEKLALHGTISVQETLPFGTVGEVKRVVENRIEACGHNGGLIIAPTHVVEPPTPIENIIALYETAQKYKPSWAR